MSVSGHKKSGRREQKKSLLRQRITEAAFQLFLDRGIESVTIDEIVTLADVSRRTFYRYFSSASDVLRAWDSDITGRLRRAVTERPADEPPMLAARNALFEVVEHYQAEQSRSITLIRLIKEVQGTGTQMSELLDDWIKGLSHGVASRLSGNESSLAAELIAHHVMSIAQAATSNWIQHGAEGDFTQFLRAAFELADKLCTQAVVAAMVAARWEAAIPGSTPAPAP